MTKKSKHKSAWNKGKTVGRKPALVSTQVTAIKTVMAERSLLRDRAMFAAAFDSCLRGCDLVRLRVSDVMLSGEMRDQVRVQPMKTKQQVNSAIDFEPSRDTHKLLQRHIEAGDLLSTDYLFTSIQPPTGPRKPLSERVYLKLVKKWVAFACLNLEVYGTHSIRRARPALIYRRIGNIRAATISAAVLRRTLSCMLRMHCRAADRPLEGRLRAQALSAQL
jgi:integrase